MQHNGEPIMKQPSQTFEEYLEQNGSMTYSNVGRSMLPLLREKRDLLTVRKKGPERCAVGDVVLYRRSSGRYILHRVVEVRPTDYVILGDNCIDRETGITDADIIGVLTGFVRGGKEHRVSEPGYRLYSFIWLHTERPRILLKKAYRRLKKHL